MRKIKVLLTIALLSAASLHAQTAIPNEGEAAMKTGRMMVKKDGQWVALKEDLTMKDGTRVTKDGVVMLKDGKQQKLAEGEYVSHDGQILKEKVKADRSTELKMKAGAKQP